MAKKRGDEKKKEDSVKVDTMSLTLERDIAFDFATKVYENFDNMIKSIVLFGSSAKKTATPDSDIDIIVIIDDVSVKWDEELIAWYREELGKIIQGNPYQKSLHVNTVKLSTWWDDLLRGDPVVINVLRYGDPLIDFGGFFNPLRVLLQQGKIHSTPESIYTLLQRTPIHMARARNSMFAAVDGLYWAAVDSAHAALIAAKVLPPSPEHIAEILEREFVKNKLMKSKYVDYYEGIKDLAKELIHGKRKEIKGKEVDEWFEKIDDFVRVMAEITEKLVEK